MCFSEKTSWITFIIGVIASITLAYRHGKTDKSMMFIALATIWVLLMQVVDAFTWRNQGNAAVLAKISNWGYSVNILQPIVFALLLLYLFQKESSQRNKNVTYILIFIYCLVITGFPIEKMIKRACNNSSYSGCNLDYRWWRGENGQIRGIVYHIVCWLLFLTMIYPKSASYAIIAYLFLTFTISSVFYNKSVASIWCWFAAFGPIIALLYKEFGDE